MPMRTSSSLAPRPSTDRQSSLLDRLRKRSFVRRPAPYLRQGRMYRSLPMVPLSFRRIVFATDFSAVCQSCYLGATLRQGQRSEGLSMPRRR